MLYVVESKKVINYIPYKGEYDLWTSRLSEAEHSAILYALTAKIGGSDIQTSSWMPGKYWAETVYEPICSKACKT